MAPSLVKHAHCNYCIGSNYTRSPHPSCQLRYIVLILFVQKMEPIRKIYCNNRMWCHPCIFYLISSLINSFCWWLSGVHSVAYIHRQTQGTIPGPSATCFSQDNGCFMKGCGPFCHRFSRKSQIMVSPTPRRHLRRLAGGLSQLIHSPVDSAGASLKCWLGFSSTSVFASTQPFKADLSCGRMKLPQNFIILFGYPFSKSRG